MLECRVVQDVRDGVDRLDALRVHGWVSSSWGGSLNLTCKAHSNPTGAHQRPTLVLTLAVGVVCGLVAVAFHMAIQVRDGRGACPFSRRHGQIRHRLAADRFWRFART